MTSKIKEMKQESEISSSNIESIRVEMERENEDYKKSQNGINNMLFEKQRLLVST